MHRLHVPGVDAVLIVGGFQYRHNRIGGARGRRQNRVIVGNLVIVNTGHNVFDIALARRGQDDLSHTLGLQVTRQTGLISPDAGVIDHDATVDTVLGVIDILGRIRVNHLDLVAVGNKRLALFIYSNGALKNAVDRVTSQETCTLEQVVFGLAAAHHHSTQPQAVAAVGFGNQYPRHQPPNATKTVKHHINRLVDGLVG